MCVSVVHLAGCQCQRDRCIPWSLAQSQTGAVLSKEKHFPGIVEFLRTLVSSIIIIEPQLPYIAANTQALML